MAEHKRTWVDLPTPDAKIASPETLFALKVARCVINKQPARLIVEMSGSSFNRIVGFVAEDVAPLMAAAPELLSFLRGILEEMDQLAAQMAEQGRPDAAERLLETAAETRNFFEQVTREAVPA